MRKTQLTGQGRCRPLIGGAFLLGVALAAAAVQAEVRFSAAGYKTVTAALQQAVDAASARGGDTVVLGAGTYPCGRLELKDNVTLKLEEGAVLKAIPKREEIMLPAGRLVELRVKLGASVEALWEVSAFVSAYGATNVAIVGKGTIDGSGRGIEGQDETPLRWKDLYFYRCRDVRLEGVTLQDPASWTCYFRECDGVKALGVTIRSHANHNNDGFDIEAKNVVIDGCDIDATDDGICFKSDNPDFVIENCLVRRSRVSSACNFIKVGTHTYGRCRNLRIEDMELSARGVSPIWDWREHIPWAGVTNRVTGLAAIALECVDGGVLEDVTVRNVRLLSGVQTPVLIRLARRHARAGETALRNVLIENLTGVAESRIASSITGVGPSARGGVLRPENIVLRHIDLLLPGGGTEADAKPAQGVPEVEDSYPENRMFGQNLPAFGFYVRHAKNVVFDDVHCRVAAADARPERVCEDVLESDDTAALQARIDALFAEGGGVLRLPAGVYRSGALFFKPGVKLHLDRGALILGVDDAAAYPLMETRIEGETCRYCPALVNADRCDGFSISGEGVIDGHGAPTWEAFWRELAAAARAGREFRNKDLMRPRLLYVSRSKGVDVGGVTLRNAKFWTAHFYDCDRVAVHDCRILAEVVKDCEGQELKGPSTDAIDIDRCRDFAVRRVYLAVNDDAVAIKGGKGPWADDEARHPENGPSRGVVIEGCTFAYPTHSCLTLGSECPAASEVTLRDSVMDMDGSMLTLKFRPDTPQRFSKIRVEGMKGRCRNLLNIGTWAQYVDCGGRPPRELKSFAEDILVRGNKVACETVRAGADDPAVFEVKGLRLEDDREVGSK